MKAWILLALALLGGWAWADPQPVQPSGTRNLGPRLIIGFKQGVTPVERAQVLQGMGLTEADVLDPFNALVAESPTGKFHPNATMMLLANPKVAVVEEDFYYPDWLKDSAVAGSQWKFPSLGRILDEMPKVLPGATIGELPWGIRRVNAPEAWAANEGAGVRVAVIDTGIDPTHPDLAPNYAGGYNAIESSKPPIDDHGHGTHVAGTIAASRDGKGVVGVAPKAKLYAVKVLDASGGGNLVSIIKGIVWCARNDIQVINMSLGSPMGSIFMKWAVQYAYAKNVVIVAAAGNSGGKVGYPGGYDEAIGVAASDSRDRIARFSARGPEVDLIAPGVDVLSTVPGGGQATFSGTSMASPHVAGLAALAVRHGASGPAGVRQALERAAVKLNVLSRDEQGAGLVDAKTLVGR